MRGAIPPLPQYGFMAWCLVKHRDFTFTFRGNNIITYVDLDKVRSKRLYVIMKGIKLYTNTTFWKNVHITVT